MSSNDRLKPAEKSPLKLSQDGNQKCAEVELGEIAAQPSSSQNLVSQEYPDGDCLFRRWALAVAWASVFLLLVLAIASFILAAKTDSSAMFGFGFDAVLDIGTSLVVIWRFYGSRGTIYSRSREHIANLILALLFLAAAISVAAKSIVYLAQGTKLDINTWLYAVTGFGLGVGVILSCIKFYVGYKLNSTAVISDGYSSLACGITALGIILSAIVYENNSSVHYLDNVVALCVAVFLAFYGIKLLVVTLMEPEVYSAMKSCCRKINKGDREQTDI